MCLFSKKKFRTSEEATSLVDTVILIAKEDIKTYKVIMFDTKGKLESAFARFEYQRHTAYGPVEFTTDTTEFHQGSFNKFFRRRRIAITVGVGFHSYSTLSMARERRQNYAIFDCIIPKGSKYIIGERDEIVSDHITILDEENYL